MCHSQVVHSVTFRLYSNICDHIPKGNCKERQESVMCGGDEVIVVVECDAFAHILAFGMDINNGTSIRRLIWKQTSMPLVSILNLRYWHAPPNFDSKNHLEWNHRVPRPESCTTRCLPNDWTWLGPSQRMETDFCNCPNEEMWKSRVRIGAAVWTCCYISLLSLAESNVP